MSGEDSAKNRTRRGCLRNVIPMVLTLAMVAGLFGLIGLVLEPRATDRPDLARWLAPDWNLTFDQFRQVEPRTSSEQRYRRDYRVIPGEVLHYKVSIGGRPAWASYDFEPDGLLRAWRLGVEMPDQAHQSDVDDVFSRGFQQESSTAFSNPRIEVGRAAVRRLAADLGGFLDRRLKLPLRVYHQTTDPETGDFALNPWARWLDGYHLIWEDEEFRVHLRYMEHDQFDESGSNPQPRQLTIQAEHKPRFYKRPRAEGELSFEAERELQDVFLPAALRPADGPPNGSLAEFQADLRQRAETAVPSPTAEARPEDQISEYRYWLDPDWSRTEEQIRLEFGQPDLEYFRRQRGAYSQPPLSCLAYKPAIVPAPGLLKYVFQPDGSLGRVAVEWNLTGLRRPIEGWQPGLRTLIKAAERLMPSGRRGQPLIEVWERFEPSRHSSAADYWHGFYRLTWPDEYSRIRVLFKILSYRRPGEAPVTNLQFLELETIPAGVTEVPLAWFPGVEGHVYAREEFEREALGAARWPARPGDETLERRAYSLRYWDFLAGLDNPAFFENTAWGGRLCERAAAPEKDTEGR